MNKQGMIDAIYEKIANKELSFGCRIMTKHNPSTEIITEQDWKYYHTVEDFHEIEAFNIIWHPVMIWDALEYFDENYTFNNIWWCDDCEIIRPNIEVNQLWKKKRLPIESQSRECVTYIYNLTK